MKGKKGCRWIERNHGSYRTSLSDSPTHASIIKKVSCGSFFSMSSAIVILGL